MKLTKTAETVLERRYYLKDEDGNCIENWESLCRRVASFIADNKVDEEAFFRIIFDLDFLPNSPTLMNAGTGIGQLSGCFVLPVEDNLKSIFKAISDGALIHQTGGGTGYSFSKIRPKNSKVNSTLGVASGPLSFASVFNAATETIKQGGKRRGANMGVLRVDHPDILEFIYSKQDETKFNNFNFSVAITDDFMQAVKENKNYNLINPQDNSVHSTLNAKEVFDTIIDLAWTNGEPGILFIDKANKCNFTPHLGDFESPNPCGEQWLLPYESCNLGSINLANFVIDNTIDFQDLGTTIKLAVRFLDKIIDKNKFPIPEVEEMTLKTRKIGLGIMGLHDMLIKLNIPYNSEEGRSKAADIMRFVKNIAQKESELLASEKGCFPAYNSTLNFFVRRNASLTSIQPTGTVSMIADCSSGCEPYFNVVVEKHVMDNDKLMLVNKHFEDVAIKEGFYSEALIKKIAETGSVKHKEIPIKWQSIFYTAQDIHYEDHIKMQAALQNNGVDSSISKTINMSNNATKDDVYNAYMLSYDLNCKGLTIYRDNSRNSQVLNNLNKKETVVNTKGEIAKLELPETLDAKRYRLKDKEGNTIYIIICFEDNEPREVFAKFPYDNRVDQKDKSTMWTTTCRLVSLALRCRIPMSEITKQLDKSSGHMFDLPAQLGKLLKSFMSEKQEYFTSCKECGGKMYYEEGCEVCKSCGYSKCS